MGLDFVEYVGLCARVCMNIRGILFGLLLCRVGCLTCALNAKCYEVTLTVKLSITSIT